MLKATFLEGRLDLTLEPTGPILVKAGESGSADPTRPDMEFVRTRRGGRPQVYLPGASLKGVVRAQAERICRSMDSVEQQQARQQHRRRFDDAEPVVPLADNPLGNGSQYGGLSDLAFSSGAYFNEVKKQETWKRLDPGTQTATIYRRSSLVSQLLGNTSLASRVRFADAYTAEPLEQELEERNGVAIDRVYGSVAVGPFNYEVAVAGQFTTCIDFKNVTLAQLGLLGLALRDLAEGRIGLGFGKSRGLGRVRVTFDRLMLYYPTLDLMNDGSVRLLNGQALTPTVDLYGIGALCQDESYRNYDFPREDRAPLPDGVSVFLDELLGVRLVADGDAAARNVWRACMPAWKRELGV